MKKPTKKPTTTKPSRPRAPDVRALSDAEVFAHYKRTAPVEDVKFHLALPLRDDVRARFAALLALLEKRGGKPSAETRAEYLACVQRWRESQLPPRTFAEISAVKWPVFYFDGTKYWTDAAGKIPAYAIATPCFIRPLNGTAKGKIAIADRRDRVQCVTCKQTFDNLATLDAHSCAQTKETAMKPTTPTATPKINGNGKTNGHANGKANGTTNGKPAVVVVEQSTTLPRGKCPVCKALVPVRRNGATREHTHNGRKCKGAGKPAVEVKRLKRGHAPVAEAPKPLPPALTKVGKAQRKAWRDAERKAEPIVAAKPSAKPTREPYDPKRAAADLKAKVRSKETPAKKACAVCKRTFPIEEFARYGSIRSRCRACEKARAAAARAGKSAPVVKPSAKSASAKRVAEPRRKSRRVHASR